MLVEIRFEVEDRKWRKHGTGMTAYPRTEQDVYNLACRALRAVDGEGPPEVTVIEADGTRRAIIPREARVHLGMHDGTTLCGIPLATLHPARWSRYAMHVDCPDCISC